MTIPKIRPAWYLVLGIAGITAANLNVSLDLAGWVASVPLLMYLASTRGYRSRMLFLLALIVAWSICIAKIITPPLPPLFIFLFSVPISLFHLPGYLLWSRFRNRRWSVFLFPAVMAVMEWIQYTFTPFASWGVAAYSQAHSLAIMQTVSLFGMAGLSFLVYWVNACLAEMALGKERTVANWHSPLAAVVLLLAFGALRYETGKLKSVDTLKVAATGTDSEVKGFPLPSKESNDRVRSDLFRRTELAARSGAKLVVWNEASTFVVPEEMQAWQDTLSTLARRLNVVLVAAFVVPLSESPVLYENKYLFFDSTGALIQTYFKHQPVPGEPAVKGREPIAVHRMAGVNLGAAICYDYDFPYLAREYGRLGADLVAVPASDWRGIDPLHSRMAAFRAVEQGHSIIRSTRFGLSTAITPYGEMVAQMSSFDRNDRVMIAHLPVKSVDTLYSRTGDVFVYLCLGFIGFFIYNACGSPAKPEST